MTKRSTFCRFSFLALLMGGTASAGEPAVKVEALTGSATVMAAVTPSETVVVFRASVPISVGSDQAVFLLQHLPGSALPPGWSAPARLFLSDGLVALLREDGTGQVYSFPSAAVPASMAGKGRWETFPVFGIARYGESKPLTSGEITKLGTGGCLTASSSDVRTLAREICLNCQSGGPGATACSTGSGGCSVTCSTGYYACCDQSSNNCRCCKDE